MLDLTDLSRAGQHLSKNYGRQAITLAALLDTTDHLLAAAMPDDENHQQVLRDALIACVYSRCQHVGIAPQAVLEARQGLRQAQATLAYLDGLPA